MLNEKQRDTIISLLQAEPIVIKEIVTDADGNDTIAKTTLDGEQQAKKTLQGLYNDNEIETILTETKLFIKDNKVKIARQSMFDKYFAIKENLDLLLADLPLLNEVIPSDDYKEIFDNDNQRFTLEIEWHKEMIKQDVTAKDAEGKDVIISTDVPKYSWQFSPKFTNKTIVKISKKSEPNADGTPKETKKNPLPDQYDSWVNALKALGKEYFTNNSVDGIMKSGTNARVIFRKVLKEHPEYISTLTINGKPITADDLA